MADTAIWNRYLQEHPGTKTLPAILPIVIYSGPRTRPWHTPLELSELIDLDQATRTVLDGHVPSLRLILDDLSTVDLPTLRARALTPAARLLLVLHKIATGNPSLGADLIPWLADLQAVFTAPGGPDDLECLVTHIFLVGETSEDDLGPVIDQLGPRAEEVIMTTAEKLRTQGREKGRAEGLVEQLSIKFGPLSSADLDRVTGADVALLRTWSHRVLTATTLDEVFSES